MWIFQLKGSVRLGMFNMPNVLFTGSSSLWESELIDPFLGIKRRFNNHQRGDLRVGFRHDIPQWRMNYGINLINRFDGASQRWDIDDIEQDHAHPMTTGFLEFIAFDDVTFRFDVRNLTDIDMCRDRIRYVGHIVNNILEEIEYMCSAQGTTLSLKVSGTF